MSLKLEGLVPGHNNCYHFHASSKYREFALVGKIAARLEQILNQKANELGWKIRALAVDSDHVHFLIKAALIPSEIAQRLFGYASFILRKEFPELKEINAEHFWGGRQCKSVADQNHFNNIVAYIGRHARAPF